MRIAEARIKNFKQFEDLHLDFTDPLGRARDLVVLVGPNTSGKTTVLDAIACALGPATQRPTRRAGLKLNTRNIVRHGVLHAEVKLTMHFTGEEIDTAREVIELSEEKWEVPDSRQVILTWRFPAENSSRFAYGTNEYEPKFSWPLFQTRSKIARLLGTGRVDWRYFERAGGCFTFDQQRTGMGKTIPRDIWQVIRGEPDQADEDPDARYTQNPRDILLALAVRFQYPAVGGENVANDFEVVKRQFGEICRPRMIKGVIRDEIGDLDLLFNDGQFDYGYGNLSSGEEMILLFLISMATQHVHRSILLIDELELHQHEVWQRRLLHALPKMGVENQLIVTTHSPYLRDVAPQGSVKELGELSELVTSTA